MRAKTIKRKHRKETSVALRLLTIRLNTQLTQKRSCTSSKLKLLCFKGHQLGNEKTEWEEILANHITDKEFIYRVYVKNSYKSAIDNS